MIKLKRMSAKEMDKKVGADTIIVKRIKKNDSRIGPIMEIRAPI